MKKQTIWILLGLSTLFYSCKEETKLPSLVLSEYAKSNFNYFDCDAGKFFKDLEPLIWRTHPNVHQKMYGRWKSGKTKSIFYSRTN